MRLNISSYKRAVIAGMLHSGIMLDSGSFSGAEAIFTYRRRPGSCYVRKHRGRAAAADRNPMYVSIPIVMLSSLGILRLAEKTKVYGDTAIGIVSSMGIATGTIMVSISGGFNVDLLSYLFGSILSISNTEVITSVILSIVVILMVLLFYQRACLNHFRRRVCEGIGNQGAQDKYDFDTADVR